MLSTFRHKQLHRSASTTNAKKDARHSVDLGFTVIAHFYSERLVNSKGM
jgi:hypothetical protein